MLDSPRRDSIPFQFMSQRLRDFVGPNHLLLRTDEQPNCAKLVGPLEQWYCRDFGRPAVHPEVGGAGPIQRCKRNSGNANNSIGPRACDCYIRSLLACRSTQTPIPRNRCLHTLDAPRVRGLPAQGHSAGGAQLSPVELDAILRRRLYKRDRRKETIACAK